MQYISNEEKQLQLLQKIEARLAQAQLTFEELSRDEQRAVFMRAVDATPLSVIYDLEMTHEACIARREAIEETKQRAKLSKAKQAGQADQSSFDEAVERISKQLPQSVK